MENVLLARVDDRLTHGQVMTSALSSMKIRKASDCCNETAIRLIIWILKPITNNGRAPGWNRSATGAKAGSNWWKFLPSRKFTTTSSPTGYPRKKPAPPSVSYRR